MDNFHIFSKFPKELRYRIWEASLPQDKGVLHTYGERWMMHHNTPGMGPPLVEVPIPVALFVCYESRAVANRWIKESKITRHYHDRDNDNGEPGMTLVRELDRDRDMIYVTRDMWKDFLENMERDYNESEGSTLCEDVRNLAVPAFTAYYSIQNLSWVLVWARHLKAIYVVWDDLPRDPYSSVPSDSDVEAAARVGDELHPRVEIVSTPLPGDTVRMKHVDTDTAQEYVEEGELEEWVGEMDDVWATTEVEEDMVDDEGGVKMPRINVRVAEIPTRGRPW